MSDIFDPTPEVTFPVGNGCALMCDIETFGTRAGCPVVTIGAVLFDPQGNDTFEGLRKRAFLRNVDVEDAIKHSHGVEGGTLKWWLKQSDAALKALVTDDAVSLKQALEALFAYATDRGPHSPLAEPYRALPLPSTFWANSPSFDYVILEAAAARVGVKWPFFFSLYRDQRTIVDAAFPNGPDERPSFNAGTHHDARDDAVAQALLIQACYAALGLSASRAEFLD